MSDTTIDDLLDKVYGVGVWVTQQRALGKLVGVKTSDTLFEAKSALYDLILKEVVGEDEQFIKPTTKRRTYSEISRYARQALKNEQRNKLKELFK